MTTRTGIPIGAGTIMVFESERTRFTVDRGQVVRLRLRHAVGVADADADGTATVIGPTGEARRPARLAVGHTFGSGHGSLYPDRTHIK